MAPTELAIIGYLPTGKNMVPKIQGNGTGKITGTNRVLRIQGTGTGRQNNPNTLIN